MESENKTLNKQDLWAILTEPTSFFQDRLPHLSIHQALGLPLFINWIVAVLEMITRTLKHETLRDGLIRMREQLNELPIWGNVPQGIWAQTLDPVRMEAIPPWIAEIGNLILNPFSTLLGWVLTASCFWLGVRLFVTEDSTRAISREWKWVLKIVATASVAKILGGFLSFLPLGLGTFIGGIYALAILLIGFSTSYRISKLRAFAIITVPSVLGGFAMILTLLLFIGLFIGVLAALVTH